jgi:hypothetical protein
MDKTREVKDTHRISVGKHVERQSMTTIRMAVRI